MKAIFLGREVNGIKIVENVHYGVDENYVAPHPIITGTKLPEIEQQFGKNAYLGFDESSNQFVVVYEERPLTNDEKLFLLQEKTAQQDAVIEELLFNIIPEITGGV